MSFIVTFRGQFRPYDLPEVSGYNRIHQGQRIDQTKEIKPNTKGYREEDQEQDNDYSKKPIKTYKNFQKSFELNKKFKYARDIMSSPVTTLYNHQNVAEAMKLMEEKSFRHIPIISNEPDASGLIGIITERDILRLNSPQKMQLILDSVMTEEVLTARETTPIPDLARIMLHENFSALPILDQSNKLVGIVTLTNILEYITKADLL